MRFVFDYYSVFFQSEVFEFYTINIFHLAINGFA